jgi:hypothetical protein
MRRLRSIVALFAAYALLFASFVGALGTARAATPGFQLCIAGTASDAPTPLRAEHELCCVLACGAGGKPMLVGGTITPIADLLGFVVSVPAHGPALRNIERLSSAAPRGPPSRT